MLKFQKWLRSLSGKWRRAACDPNLDCPQTICRGSAAASPRGPSTESGFVCAKCGKLKTLSAFRQQPCAARSAKLGIVGHDWVVKMRGAEVALRLKESLRTCARKWRRTDKGQAASKAREDKRRGTRDWSRRNRKRS